MFKPSKVYIQIGGDSKDLSHFYQFCYKKLLKCIKYQRNERTNYKFIPDVLKMTFVITKL